MTFACRVLSFVLLLLFTHIALATPGNAPDARPADKSTDLRLTRKITYKAIHKPVRSVIADLAQMSGVTLRAGSSDQDWQVRDRKMNIFVKDLPLSNLMNSVAHVMKFEWTRRDYDDGAPPTYRLVQDRTLIGRLTAEQNRRQHLFETEIVGRRQRLVDTLDRLAGLSDADGARLRQENPYHYQLWKTGAAKAGKAVFDELPDVKEAFLTASMNVNLPVSRLSPEAQQLLLDGMRGNWPYRQFQLESKEAFPEDIVSRLSECNICMENVPRPFTDWQNTIGTDFGGLGVSSPLGFFLVSYYTDPDVIGQQLNAETYLRGVEQGATREQIDAQLKDDPRQVTSKKEDAEINEQYLMLDPAIEHPDEPALQLKVNLKVQPPDKDEDSGNAQWKRFAAIEEALANASGFSIVSDSFNRNRGGADPAAVDVKLQAAMDAFVKGYFYNWDHKDGVVEFRCRDWFRKRGSQIPDEWIERWREILKKKGTMTLAEYAPLATLSFEQLSESVFPDSVLSCTASTRQIVANQPILNLYLTLSPEQRSRMFLPQGLPLASLTSAQWQIAEALCHYKYNSNLASIAECFANGGQGSVLLGVYETKENHYVISIKGRDGHQEDWSISMPVYKAKDAPAGNEKIK
jgi:hypothetical protein